MSRQVDLLVPTKVTGVITQGAKDFGRVQFVGSYKVAYSNDGERWNVYQDEKQRKDKVTQPRTAHRQTANVFTETKSDAPGEKKLRGLTSARVGGAWTCVLNYASSTRGQGAVWMEGKKRTENMLCRQTASRKKFLKIYGSGLVPPPHFGICLFYFPLPVKRLFIRGSN